MKAHEILGIPAGATKATIKAAYKKKVMQCHPDKGGDPEAFIEVVAAYKKLVGAVSLATYSCMSFSAFNGMSIVKDKPKPMDTTGWIMCDYCLGLGESANGKCPMCKGVGRLKP